MKRRVLLHIVFLFCLIPCKGSAMGSVSMIHPGFAPTSSDRKSWFTDKMFSLNYHYGAIVPEYSSFIYTVNSNVTGFSFNFSKQTIGEDDWQVKFKYPEVGLSFYSSSQGNRDVYGREFAFFPYATLHIVETKKLAFDYTLGIGLSYITKKFDLENNYTNVAIASYLNIHFNTKFSLTWKAFPNLFLRTGIGFDHLSNGNFQEPNIGINSVTLFGGLSYGIKGFSERKIRLIPDHVPTWKNELVYAAGGKFARALSSQFFFTSSLMYEKLWKCKMRFHLAGGLDLFYDTSSQSEMESQDKVWKPVNDFSGGVHITQYFVYNRLSVALQEGIYLLPNKTVGSIMYNRGIIKYDLTDRFSVRITMKSHLHILDYPELGIGLKW